MPNSSRPRRGRKTSPELATLKADLARIDRERKNLERQIITKAAEAEQAAVEAKSKKRKRPKAKKRAWKCGVPIPYEGFPLTPHATGNWSKKIRGTLHYFGRWGRIVDGKMERLPGDGWKNAVDLYEVQREALYAGRKPQTVDDGSLTVKELGDRFLTAKHRKLEAGELAPRTFSEYQQTAQMLADQFGKNRVVSDLAADDFEKLRAVMAKRWGPVRLGNEITRVKSVFKYAADNGLILQPVRYGSEFKKPDKTVMRRHRNTGGKKLFSAAELRLMLKKLKPDPLLRAAVLLGINGGLGNTDVANLQFEHLDLKSSWLDYPRGKTGIPRRVPLWAETVKALKEVIAARPTPKDEADEHVVFLTPRRNGDIRSGGTRLVVVGDKSRTDYVCREFGTLIRDLKINGRRGLGFYSLRHTFATVGKECKDRDAVKAIMGHADSDMLAAYDETGPSDDRLLVVTNHVRAWLFGGAK